MSQNIGYCTYFKSVKSNLFWMVVRGGLFQIITIKPCDGSEGIDSTIT